MELQKDTLLSNLFNVRPTEEHLKSMAFLLKTFEVQFNIIADGLEYVHGRSSIHHRITLYYLINEVLNAGASTEIVSRLKAFINKNFSQDLKISEKFEFLNKKLLQLEKFWIKKNLLVVDEFSLEELTFKIKSSFNDKEKLIAVLQSALDHFKSDKLN